jgi:hypothetical protein
LGITDLIIQQDDDSERLDRSPRDASVSLGLPDAIIKPLVLAVGVYLFLFGFIFAACVFMSNDDLSPEISLDFIHRPIKSILLLALVAAPFVLMMAVGRGGRFAWFGLQLFAIAMAAVGIYAASTSHGLFEAISGDGSLRHYTGLVYAGSSVLVLAITAIPGLRRRVADGF